MANMSLDAEIREAVREKLIAGDTQDKICGRANVDRGSLSRWYAGKQTLRSDSLRRVAEAVGLVMMLRRKLEPSSDTVLVSADRPLLPNEQLVIGPSMPLFSEEKPQPRRGPRRHRT